MKTLNALHNLYCDDMTYQEYYTQLVVNGRYSAIEELLNELNQFALLRLYKFAPNTTVQGYIEEIIYSRTLKKYIRY